jgi:hypothetical protein
MPTDAIVAVLKPSRSDDDCIVELYHAKQDDPTSKHALTRYPTGIVVDHEPDIYSSGPVDANMKLTVASKALTVPIAGSLIFHVAAAMTRRGYVCLLRDDQP